MQSSSSAPIPAPNTPSVHARVGRRRQTPILSNAPITLGTVPLLPPVRNTSPLSTPEEPTAGSNTTIAANLQSAPPLDLGAIPVDAMKLVVQETLRQMGIESAHVSSSAPGKARSRARSLKEVRMQQSSMSKDHDLAWKVSSSQHCKDVNLIVMLRPRSGTSGEILMDSTQQQTLSIILLHPRIRLLPATRVPRLPMTPCSLISGKGMKNPIGTPSY